MPSRPSPLHPRYWAIHLVALLLTAAAGALGYWQLHAWQQKRDAEARDLTLLSPVALQSVLGPDDPFPGDAVGRPTVLSGRWVADSSFLVSGRERGDVDGYWVVSVLETGPDRAAIPVVRGWSARPSGVPAAPSGEAEFVGWLQPAEGTGEVDADPSDDVIPQLRIADALHFVDQDLYGAYAVVADEAAPGDWPVGAAAVNAGTTGLEQAELDQLPESPRFSAIRNLFYALEWWVFGGFAVFMWWRWLRDDVLGAPVPGDEDDIQG